MKITNEAEYQAALDRIAVLFDIVSLATEEVPVPEEQEWTVLTLAVEEYERQKGIKLEAMFSEL